MAIKIHDLRYIRRSPGEIAVLRELVSFQRSQRINPSEFWLSQMTRMSERSVRRALVKLAKSGLISFVKHKQDFRGPLRPTNTYTLHPERIQELIDEGKVAVKRAMDQYYEQAGTPRHVRKRPAKLTGHPPEQPAKLAGYTTGQIGPQDVSLSKEQDYAEDSTSSFGEADEASYEASSDDWEELQELENEELTGEVEDQSRMLNSSKEPVQSTLITELTIPTPSPNSAPPPSPPLPAGMGWDSSIKQVDLALAAQDVPNLLAKPEGSARGAAESFDDALRLFRRTKVYRDPSQLELDRERWVSLCNMYGRRQVADHFAYYVKDSDAKSPDVLFKRFFGYITENLHLKRIDQPGTHVTAEGRESKSVDRASSTFDEAA